jgi:hypothetical protein
VTVTKKFVPLRVICRVTTDPPKLFTVSVAGWLVALPPGFVTVTVYSAASLTRTEAMLNVAAVAPGMGALFFFH